MNYWHPVDELMADGGWHTFDEILDVAAPHIPPGRAARTAERCRNYEAEGPRIRAMTADRLVEVGRRVIVRDFTLARVGRGRWIRAGSQFQQSA